MLNYVLDLGASIGVLSYGFVSGFHTKVVFDSVIVPGSDRIFGTRDGRE